MEVWGGSRTVDSRSVFPAGPAQGALVCKVRTAQAGMQAFSASVPSNVPAPTSTPGRKLPTLQSPEKLPLVGSGSLLQCVPQFLLRGGSRAEVGQGQLKATEVPLYRHCSQDWAGRSLLSSFPTEQNLSNQPSGASPWEVQSWDQGSGERIGGGGQPARPPRHRLLLTWVPSTADARVKSWCRPLPLPWICGKFSLQPPGYAPRSFKRP